MNQKSFFKQVIEVALSNCTTIISGIVIGFVIPKLLSVDGYGYYKTFTLYVTYIGFFSLGIIDGIVLEYGNKNYDQLDRPSFRAYFKWYFVINSFFMFVIIAIGIILLLRRENNIGFIMIMLGIDLIAVNITGYFQQISQITLRFREYSLRKVLQSIFNILAVGALFLTVKKGEDASYELYIALVVAINVVLTFWYIVTYKEIIFGNSLKMRLVKNDIVSLSIKGVPLLVANICSTLIITLDRQFVNVLFDTKTYAVYAFAYSMLSLVTVAISAISTVLYPTIKRTNENTLKSNYGLLVSAILTIVYACISAYFPICLFIKWFLPKYVGSLVIFRVIFPGLAVSSAITIVMHNYYKALGKAVLFFKKSVVVLVLSCVANIIAYVCFKSTIAISAASIITMIIWYLYVEEYFIKAYGYNGIKNLSYMLLMLIVFYIISGIQNDISALLIYVVCYLIITIVLYKNSIINVLKRGRKS